MQPPDFEDPLDSLDSYSEKRWATVPEPIRKDVEQHVLTNLPDNLLTRLRDVHARGIPISSEDAFFHFGGGMGVRNLCRERLSDEELAGIVNTMRARGLTSVRSIAEALNDEGIPAPRGDKWHPTAVSRLLKRLSTQGTNTTLAEFGD